MNAGLPSHQPLKYRPLSRFVGQHLTIPAFGEIEKTLLHEMDAALPAQFSLDSGPLHKARVMAKYGILDLTFTTGVSVLGTDDQISWDALRMLALAVGEGQLDEGFEFVERGLRDDTCFLRVFLTCAPPWDAMQLRNDRAMPKMKAGVAPQLAFEDALDELAENIAQQFPVTFVIDGACLTNSRWIWTNRYFYL